MDKLFLTLLNMSLTGAFVIAAICVARLSLKKAPKIISYCLWAVAGFRLVFPFSIESVFSLIPFKAQTIPPDIAMQPIPRIDSGIPFVNNAVSSILPAATPTASINPLQIWTTIGAFVWLIGVAVMLIYGVVSFVILKQKMKEAAHVEGNIYEAENIKSPFVLGVFKPKIYLRIGLSAQERSYIILHEQTHIRRRDHIVKFAAYFILCLHWFNPLAWVAFLLMGVDMEMSCDERVLKEMGGEAKKDYSLLLLSLATERRIIGGSPLAFGEGGVKGRIKNVLNFKKPSRVIIVAAVALVAVLSVGLAVSRAGDETNYDIPDITATETIDGAQAKALRFGYSWYDGKNGVEADAIAPWQGEYADENTLVIDGEMGQNMIALSAEKPMTASYEIYLPDGTLYDKGTREVYDSLSPRLYWTGDKTGVGVVAPFEPDEYIYAVTIGWEKNDLKVTYGFKLVMTGKSNAYDEALNVIWNHHNDALSVSFTGVETLPDAEYAGDCYVFEVELPDGMKQVAVSKERGIFFTYSDGTWFAFTGASTDLETAVSEAILESNNNDFKSGDFAAEAHTTLAIVEEGDTVTVYLMVLYQVYGYSGGGFSELGGSHMPVAITFDKRENSGFVMTEYWTPRDGTYYAPSIREKFPPDIYEDAIDTQKYIYAHQMSCYEQAVEYGDVDTDYQIASLIEIICSSPAEASNPGAYIEAHSIEFRELLYYGRYTLDYCFNLFEQGGQTGLEGHIMVAACRDIMTILGETVTEGNFDTGQDWYNAQSVGE